MLTDPKTSPKGQKERVVYAVSVGLLAALLIAPLRTEWASKVALLGALTIVCAARPLLALVRPRVSGRRLALAGSLAVVGYGAALLVVNNPPATAASDNANGALPSITILRSHGVQTQPNLRTARV